MPIATEPNSSAMSALQDIDRRLKGRGASISSMPFYMNMYLIKMIVLPCQNWIKALIARARMQSIRPAHSHGAAGVMLARRTTHKA